MALAWLPYDNYVCGAVAISASEKKIGEMKNRAQPQHMDININLTDDMSFCIFTLTVTDDGSNIADQPSLLWNSCATV
jgi:hypothetical protein